MLSSSINSTANPAWLLRGTTKHLPKASQEGFVTSQVRRGSAGVSRPGWQSLDGPHPAGQSGVSGAELLGALGVGTAAPPVPPALRAHARLRPALL